MPHKAGRGAAAAAVACLLAGAVAAPDLPAAAPDLPAAASRLTLVAGGDVALAQPVRGEMRPVGGADPLGGARLWLESADVSIVNLESPLCLAADPDSASAWPPLLQAAPELAAVIPVAGIDLVSVANNHALDCGPTGVAGTVAALEALGLRTVGVLQPGENFWQAQIVEVAGVRVAVIAVSLVPLAAGRGVVSAGTGVRVAMASLERAARRLPDAVRELVAGGSVDAVIVSLHWGIEGTTQPQPEQVELGRALVDAGAVLVVGHHPHVVQPVEAWGDGLIAYSLGNLLFGGPASEGALLEVALEAGEGRWRVEAHRLVALTFADGRPTAVPEP